MATKNHKRSMSQPERAFWRDAFLNAPISDRMLVEQIEYRANFADLAVEEYRKRVTWRSHE